MYSRNTEWQMNVAFEMLMTKTGASYTSAITEPAWNSGY